MIGSMISHYRILEKLGEGGMGVVYKANDTKLDRSVALKLLPGHLSQSEDDKKRFVQEARAASALDHPNICTIYEITETPDGTMIIVMPAYDGTTLSSRIDSGPMKIGDILGLAIQIADGLHAAHEKGIIHRDLKSGNILITGKGQVKIIDFGLARKEGAAQLTKTGTTIGTVPYMSPEQARGEKVDARSDIWSLGVIIYQMIRGRLPFQSDYNAAVVYAILNEEPEPLTSLRSNVPLELERIVKKAMQKDRNFRYRSAEELLIDLKTVQRELQNEKPVEHVPLPATVVSPTSTSTSTSTSKPTPTPTVTANGNISRGVSFNRVRLMLPTVLIALAVIILLAAARYLFFSSPADEISSIAVLPLTNLSGDPDQEYFSDGMTDALISNLAGIEALRVISRTSIMQYKNTTKSLPEIARELNVDAIVEASVMRSGEQVRISARLIDGKTEKHLWSDSYTRGLRDILMLQSDVARAIAGEIRIKLTQQEIIQLAASQQVNTEAFEANLRARYYWNRRNPESLYRAIEYYEQAIAYDPGYADAYRGLAATYMILSIFFNNPLETLPKAKENLDKALALDDRVLGGNLGLGAFNLFHNWNWPEAERYMNREIELHPGFDQVYNVKGVYLASRGRGADAVAEFQKALRLDPLSLIINTDFGWAYYMMRQYDLAILQCQRAIDIDPGFLLSYVNIAAAYSMKGEYDRAISVLEPVLRRAGDSFFAVPVVLLTELGYAYAASGRIDQAEQIVGVLETRASEEYIDPYLIALMHIALDQYDVAFELLYKALESRSTRMIWLDVEPKIDPLRADSRFAEFRAATGFQK